MNEFYHIFNVISNLVTDNAVRISILEDSIKTARKLKPVTKEIKVITAATAEALKKGVKLPK